MAGRPSTTALTCGGVRSTTNAALAASLSSPAWLVPRTSALYLPPCASPSTTAAGTPSTLTSAPAVAFHTTSPLDAATTATEYERTPLQPSSNPNQLTRAAVVFVTNASAAPDDPSTCTLPTEGAEQQTFAPLDATACRSPAQLLARTAR